MKTVKLAQNKVTGRSYIVTAEEPKKVRCKGPVVRVSGFSAMHGNDLVFLREAVNLREEPYTEELLHALCKQDGGESAAAKIEPINQDENAWVEWEGRRARLTPYADAQLQAEGYDVGMDGLGNYLDEGMLQDAAMDSALYHHELTRAGVREEYTPCREAAADMIYEGMLKALKEKKAAGKKVTL